jgi:hypothetical protein
VSQKRALRRTFGPSRDEVTGEWTKSTVGRFIICTHHQYYQRDQIKDSHVGGTWGRRGRGEKVFKVLVGRRKERDHSVDRGVLEGWLLNGSFRNWLEGCGVDSHSSR